MTSSTLAENSNATASGALTASSRKIGGLRKMWMWLSNDPALADQHAVGEAADIDWYRAIPFIGIHLACLAVVFTGISAAALGVAVALYVLRMFFITAIYHRYFSHRSYSVGRVTQFVMAVLGCTAGQRGPLWWAGHHREHHLTSDTPADPHSPLQHGFLHSHTVWFLTKGSFVTPAHRVRDWYRFPELVWLERFEWVPFVALGALCFGLGVGLETHAPQLGTTGPQLLVVGFFWSSVALYHGTYSTNSIAHKYGRRRFDTTDDSRNNGWVAFLTLGEGWHNNHHRFPVSARHGLSRWELDPTWWGLKTLSRLGIVRDLRVVPESVMEAIRLGKQQ